MDKMNFDVLKQEELLEIDGGFNGAGVIAGFTAVGTGIVDMAFAENNKDFYKGSVIAAGGIATAIWYTTH